MGTEPASPTWRKITDELVSATLGFYVLTAYYEWDLLPNWLVVSTGWTFLTLGLLLAVLGSAIRLLDRVLDSNHAEDR